MAIEYFKVHGGRLSFREYWNMAPDPFTFLIAAVMKPFGGFPFSFSIPLVDELHIVEFDDLPSAPRRALRKSVEKFEALGFQLTLCHELPLIEKHRYGAAAIMLGPDRRTFAAVNFSEDKVISKYVTSCVSQFDDESFGTTTTMPEGMKPNPKHHVARHVTAGPATLVELHAEHLAEWEDEVGPPVRLTPQTLADAVLAGERGHVEYHIDRGVYIPMSKAEVKRSRAAGRND